MELSEHPRVAGKHLTGDAKNGYAAVAIYSNNPASRASKFLVENVTNAGKRRKYASQKLENIE